MSQQQIGISFPNQLIEDLVRAAVVRELGQQEKLIEGIVSAALKQKESSYDKETLFQKMVSKMIRDVAEESVHEWVQQNKERIQAAFIAHLNSPSGEVVNKLVNGMVDGLSNYSIRVNFDWKRE